jgi:hypothetical protein
LVEEQNGKKMTIKIDNDQALVSFDLPVSETVIRVEQVPPENVSWHPPKLPIQPINPIRLCISSRLPDIRVGQLIRYYMPDSLEFTSCEPPSPAIFCEFPVRKVSFGEGGLVSSSLLSQISVFSLVILKPTSKQINAITANNSIEQITLFKPNAKAIKFSSIHKLDTMTISGGSVIGLNITGIDHIILLNLNKLKRAQLDMTSKLEMLNCPHFRFSDSSFDILKELRILGSKDLDTSDISGLKNLRHLSLSGKISWASFNPRDLMHLKTLFIAGNSLSSHKIDFRSLICTNSATVITDGLTCYFKGQPVPLEAYYTQLQQ